MMIAKRSNARSEVVQVKFFIPTGAWATEISLVGDFNNWDPEVHQLEHSLHNGWRITLELPRGREYHYRYLVDGREWLNDNRADDYAPNPYGGQDSIVLT